MSPNQQTDLKNWLKDTSQDHLLYLEFTEALRIGKTLDESIKIINKIYILHYNLN